MEERLEEFAAFAQRAQTRQQQQQEVLSKLRGVLDAGVPVLALIGRQIAAEAAAAARKGTGRTQQNVTATSPTAGTPQAGAAAQQALEAAAAAPDTERVSWLNGAQALLHVVAGIMSEVLGSSEQQDLQADPSGVYKKTQSE